MERFVAWSVLALVPQLSACGASEALGGAAAPIRPTTTAAPSATASAVTPASMGSSAPSPAKAGPSPFEIVLEQRKLHDEQSDAMYFAHLPVDEGLLVVASMPAMAFLVKGAEVKTLDGFFDGIRSPAPDWDAGDFMVSELEGTLDALRFKIYAPSTEYADEISGRPGRWRARSGRRSGAKAIQPAWVSERTIAVPITTAKGARLYQVAPSYEAPATDGFAFHFDGPSKGEALPTPAAGHNGCRYAMLGHPFLTLLDDGTLVGLGTLCTSGADYISTAKLDGIAPPLQTNVPRFGRGHIAAEHWKGGRSVVQPLPGAEQVAQYASFDLVKRGPTELYVVTQRERGSKTESYVAMFDGARWSDVTPPSAPEALLPFLAPTHDLYLFHQSGGFRRTPAGWDRIAFDRSEPCGSDAVYHAAQSAAGDLFVGGALGCLWRIGAGSRVGRHVSLPGDLFVGTMVAHRGELYLFADGVAGATLLRLKSNSTP